MKKTSRTLPVSPEQGIRRQLYEQRWMRLHIVLIALCTFLLCWGSSSLLMRAGVEHLAVRYGLATLLTYLGYVALLRLWSAYLLRRDDGVADGSLDAADVAIDVADLVWPRSGSGGGAPSPFVRSGGDGDFGGAGSSAHFDGPGAMPDVAPVAQTLKDWGPSLGDVGDALGSADEGAVVIVPLAVVVGLALLLSTAFGVAVFGLFGVEVLTAVAVEIALASAGGALAVKAQREGWLSLTLRKTAWPMALVCGATVAMGALLEAFVPQVNTLPAAIRLLLS